MRRALIFCVPLLSLSGCAGTMMAYKYEITTADHIKPEDPDKLRTLSGDRRLVRQSKIEPDGFIEICAETQADAMTAYSGQGSASAGYGGATGSLSDQYGEQLTLTNTRGQVSDVVRQLAWHWCNAHMNGWIDDATYVKEMGSITISAFAALEAAAKTGSAPTGPTPAAPVAPPTPQVTPPTPVAPPVATKP